MNASDISVSPNPYRILSLDGGGSWALIQARALGELFGDATDGHTILAKFDLVVANSGGSLVLAALASGRTPKQIEGLFLTNAVRRSLFAQKWRLIPHNTFKSIELRPKYLTTQKLEGLRSLLNDTTGLNPGKVALADVPLDKIGEQVPVLNETRLLIIGFDYDRERVDFFRSHDTKSSPTLAEATHASSNAPILFFDFPAEFESKSYEKRRYWDGAMAGMNNPILAGITEAIGTNHADGSPMLPSDIHVISIGTASVQLPPEEAKAEGDSVTSVEEERQFLWKIQESSTFASDIKKAAGVINDDPPDSASFIAHRWLMGADNAPFGRLVRLNPLVQPDLDGTVWRLPQWEHFHPHRINLHPDSEEIFKALVDLGMDAVEDTEVNLVRTLCDAWIAGKARNQPVRTRGDTMRLSIGHDDFPSALAVAKILMGL